MFLLEKQYLSIFYKRDIQWNFTKIFVNMSSWLEAPDYVCPLDILRLYNRPYTLYNPILPSLIFLRMCWRLSFIWMWQDMIFIFWTTKSSVTGNLKCRQTYKRKRWREGATVARIATEIISKCIKSYLHNKWKRMSIVQSICLFVFRPPFLS